MAADNSLFLFYQCPPDICSLGEHAVVEESLSILYTAYY